MKLKQWIIIGGWLLCSIVALPQTRLDSIQQSLQKIATDAPGLNEKVELSVSGVSLQEFIRGIGAAHQLNVSVDPALKGNVVNNFSNAKVADVFLFLCKQYQLDIDFIGSIIAFKPYVKPKEKPKPYVAKKPGVNYYKQTDFLSLELRKDTLDKVAEEITKQSLKNVVLAPGLENQQVSVFIQNRPFDNALDKLAFANGLKITKTDDHFYLITNADAEEVVADKGRNGSKRSGNKNNKKGQGFMEMKIKGDRITLEADNAPTIDLIEAASKELFKNYFLFNKPEGVSTLYIENATYEEFLNYLLNGSKYTFKNQEGIYLIGERNLEGLRKTELLQLENRTVESIIEVIPPELKEGVDIKEFVELNGLILSGSHPNIYEIKEFVRAIDKVVPMVMIEVMIVDVNKSTTTSVGINAGLGGGPQTTGGTISPGANFNLNSSSVNQLINSFNGFGWVNLGNVSPDFYLSIQALESDGILKTRSTPKLSTLNGHEANLKIGRTEYYLEVQNNVIGTQNPSFVTTQTYKPTNADLSVTIKPTVSADEHVTLDIQVDQSDFTGRIDPNAPPGNVSRSFQSIVRIKNGETILLGGLEDKSTNNTSSGLPLLARIPVLNWFFGQKTREKSKSKLNIFIKATTLY